MASELVRNAAPEGARSGCLAAVRSVAGRCLVLRSNLLPFLGVLGPQAQTPYRTARLTSSLLRRASCFAAAAVRSGTALPVGAVCLADGDVSVEFSSGTGAAVRPARGSSSAARCNELHPAWPGSWQGQTRIRQRAPLLRTCRDRASASQAECRRFESDRPLHYSSFVRSSARVPERGSSDDIHRG